MPQHLLLLRALLGESGVQLPPLLLIVASVDRFPTHTATAATAGDARASTIDVHSGTTVTAAG
jgi:hypothetical protein